MEEIRLNAQVREGKGKERCRKLRSQHRIPAVLYGDDKKNLPLTVGAKETEKVLHKLGDESVIVTLDIEGVGEQKVLIKDIQRHVVTDQLLHMDFYRVSMERKLKVEVPLHPVGKAAGVERGGVLEQLMNSIEVRCLPGQIPSHIDVDVSRLDLNWSLHVRELPVPEGVEVMEDEDKPVFTVLVPAALREEEEVPVEEVAEEEEKEPELVGKGKEKEEEEAEEKEKKT